MDKKAVSGIMLTLLLLSVLTLAFNIQLVKSEPRTWTVDDDGPADFSSIQEAINVTSDGDTIFVHSGTYYENIAVNKTLSLIGENKHNTIIDGGVVGNVVSITANSINISAFTIQNSGPEGKGIYVYRSSGNTISYNIIVDNWFGVQLRHSNNNAIYGNKVSNNSWGIELEGGSKNNTVYDNYVSNNSGDGIRLSFSSNNILSNNTVLDNHIGIELSTSGGNILASNSMASNYYNFGVLGYDFSHYNNHVDTSNTVDEKPIYYLVGVANAVYHEDTNAGTIYLINCNNITIKDLTLTKNWNGVFFWNITNSKIENTTASKNWAGIYLRYSNNNTITSSNFSDNIIGIELDRSRNNTLSRNTVSSNLCGIDLSYSSNNIFFHNNFFNNTEQMYDMSSTNTWDDGYPSGGNYWSDYSIRYPDVIDEYSGENQDVLGSDGIWDHPYIIDFGLDLPVVYMKFDDRYPFVDPWASTINATVGFVPVTLNMKSKGKWNTAYIELPEDYNVEDIDVSTIMLNDSVPAESNKVCGRKLMVRFDRSEVIALLPQIGEVELTVTGKLFNGPIFEGSDTIRVR